MAYAEIAVCRLRRAVRRTLLLAWLLPVMAAAESLPLTEAQALRLFYERNLDLLAARYNIDSYRAREIIAAAIPNPSLTVAMMELSKNSGQGSTAVGCPAAQGVPGHPNCGPAPYYTFSQLIETAGRRGLRMQAGAIATQAAESDFRDAARIFTNMVRDDYYALLLAQKNRELAQEMTGHYRHIVQNCQLRLQAGDMAESDFMRVNVEAMRAQTDLETAQTNEQKARNALARILNWPAQAGQYAAVDPPADFRPLGQDLPRQQLINLALAQRPDLSGDRQRADQAAKVLQLVGRLNYPNLTVNVGYAHDPGNTVLDTAFVGASAEVPVFYQHKGEVRQAQANLEQMRVAAAQTEAAIRNDVIAAQAAWQSANHVVDIYRGSLLQRSLAVRERIELAFAHGAVGVMALIDAQREYQAIMLAYHTAVINRINAYYDLARALGVEPDAELAPLLNDPDRVGGEATARGD